MKPLYTTLAAVLLFFLPGCGGVHRNDFDRAYRWPDTKAVVTYRFVPAGDATAIDLAPIHAQDVTDDQKAKMRNAFGHWQDLGGPTMQETTATDTSADIDVVNQSPDDFDAGTTEDELADTRIYVPSDGFLHRAVVRLRSDVTGDRATAVCDHEAGHALGLRHSGSVVDVMYPIAHGLINRVFGFSSGDRRAIRNLYGSTVR